MTRSYHHGNLRAALVETAAELARADGPDGVVLREVARRTGVSHNAAYRHFADREELLAEVAQLGMDAARAGDARPDGHACAPGTRDGGRYAGCARPGGPTCTSRWPSPGLFAVAFSTPIAGARRRRPLRAAQPGARRPRRRGCDAARPRAPAPTSMCWAGVHGFAMLHLRGPLRDVPEPDRELLSTGASTSSSWRWCPRSRPVSRAPCVGLRGHRRMPWVALRRRLAPGRWTRHVNDH